MKQNYCDTKPNSFAETIQLVESYVKSEVVKETKEKQLYYHTLDHALAVKRRAMQIFQAIKPVLAQNYSASRLERIRSLTSLCGLAHDMVQIFEPLDRPDRPRKHQIGFSEAQTATKLLQYIKELNQELATEELDSEILFSDRDLQIIKDAILATICLRDPLAGKAKYTFSPHSIYQPYLYDAQPKISIVGSIIALADLGTLGIDGVNNYIQDAILIFLEDNPSYASSLTKNCKLPHQADTNTIKARLLAMNRFVVALAKERKARFELEIASFSPQARQILRDRVFVYLNQKNIDQVEQRVPTQEQVSLDELIDFLCSNKN